MLRPELPAVTGEVINTCFGMSFTEQSRVSNDFRARHSGSAQTNNTVSRCAFAQSRLKHLRRGVPDGVERSSEAHSVWSMAGRWRGFCRSPWRNNR